MKARRPTCGIVDREILQSVQGRQIFACEFGSYVGTLGDHTRNVAARRHYALGAQVLGVKLVGGINGSVCRIISLYPEPSGTLGMSSIWTEESLEVRLSHSGDPPQAMGGFLVTVDVNGRSEPVPRCTAMSYC